jgi:hypothetical protein
MAKPHAQPLSRLRISGVLIALLVSIAVALTGWLDEPARALNDAALQRALITFAVARTLNGVISMAQGTEVAVQPAGVGVNFTPGQLLDPVNDLVESFSSVMLYASVALGTQKLLLGIGSGLWLSLLLLATTLTWVYLRQRCSPYARTAGRVLLSIWLLRFAVPLITVSTESAFNLFLQPEYQRSSAELQSATERLSTLSAQNQPESNPDESLLDRAGRWINNAQASLDISARMEQLKMAATAAIGNVIDLIVVFMLQTVAIPSALLWLGWRLVRRRFGGSEGSAAN